MNRRAAWRSERGLIMMGLLSMILVLTILAALVLFLSGKEAALTGVRLGGSESLYIAEGGAYAGRAALMAYMNAYPMGVTSVDPSLTTTTAAAWYATGNNAAQNPFGVLDYLVTDGQRFSLGATPTTASETFQVNWGSAYPHLKLVTAGTPANPLGPGTYAASVTLQPNPTPDASCAGGPCAIHQTAPDAYEIFYKYYGAFGTFNPSTGLNLTGYGRAFTYDTRMSRGFTPPFFPTTNLFVITDGSQLLAGVKPTWREATPP